VRLLIRGLTSNERKHPGGRGKDRRRDRRRGSPAEALKDFNPEIAERTNEAEDPIQTDGDASCEPPTQHVAILPREHPVELGTEIGAACLESNTALLLQDPLNHSTYDPSKTLTSSIGSLRQGDTVLAEKHGPDGRGNFFLATATCVMLFEIPQDEDPDANNIIQENTISTGLGIHTH